MVDPDDNSLIAGGAQAILAAAMHQTALALEAQALELRLEWINERDHLQRVYEAAVTSATRETAPDTRVCKPKLGTRGWPRLGAVDLALVQADRAPAIVELKAGRGKNALGAVAWDAGKCAYLLQHGEASEAFLLAAAPTATWETKIDGAEFLSDGEWLMLDARDRYRSWFRMWERDGFPVANEMPRAFATRWCADAHAEISRVPWLLRLAAVHSTGRAWIRWPPILDP